MLFRRRGRAGAAGRVTTDRGGAQRRSPPPCRAARHGSARRERREGALVGGVEAQRVLQLGDFGVLRKDLISTAIVLSPAFCCDEPLRAEISRVSPAARQCVRVVGIRPAVLDEGRPDHAVVNDHAAPPACRSSPRGRAQAASARAPRFSWWGSLLHRPVRASR